ncbi:MAG: hypothetical protein AB7G11_09245 [Phycisphaerales bacterium]
MISGQCSSHALCQRLATAVLLVCGAGVAPSIAQNALGDGRLLDRNPRVGSNGRNPSQANSIANITRFNNAVVTGNVGGGKSFQGYVGYLASNDFRASLGSNDLFQFRRDSSSGSAVASGIKGTDALRYQFGLVTGQTPPSLLGAASATGASLVTDRAGSSGVSPGAALRSTSDFLTERSLRPSVIGYRTEQDGRQYALTASPLTGVTMVPLRAPETLVPSAERPQVPGTSGLPSLPGTSTPRSTPGRVDQSTETLKIRHGGLSGVEASRPGLSSPFAVAQLIDQSSPAARLDTRIETPSTVLDPFKNSLPADKRNSPEPTPGATDAAKPAWMLELDKLSERLKGDDDTEKTDASDRKSPFGSGTPTLDQIREFIKPDLEKIDKDVTRALASARPLLDRLSPEKPTDNKAYDQHMATGEKLLGEGRYFDAEDRFLRALAARAGDPMASLGRIHAQLGAGTYLSAAMNLHTLLQEHPEMMTTRYAKHLQPTDKRADAIATQMRENIHATRTLLGKDAALLLAYLGYQRHDQGMIEEGVRAFAERTSERDTADRTLLALMQRLWVDADRAEPPAEPAK